MKLRLLFTISIPALCSVFGMEIRGMEQAKQLASAAITLAGVGAKSLYDHATKTTQAITLEQNTQIQTFTRELDIPGIKENGNVFCAALKDLGINTDGYAYANTFVAKTTRALQGTQDYNITHLLNLLSDSDKELMHKKTALFFITAFLRQPNNLEARKSLCEVFCNGCNKTELEHHNQLIGCYKKIFEYTGRNHTYFVLDYMRTIMVEAMRHTVKSRDLLRKTFVELGDIKGPECLLKKTLATVDSVYIQAHGEEPKRNPSVALNNKRSHLYLIDIREIVSKNPSINLGNYWLSGCSSGAIQEELKRALFEKEFTWAQKILAHENGSNALKTLLKRDHSLWKMIAQLDSGSELLSAIKQLKEHQKSWRDSDTQFILNPECIELAAQAIPEKSPIFETLGDDFSAAVMKRQETKIATSGDIKAVLSKKKPSSAKHTGSFEKSLISQAETLDALIEKGTVTDVLSAYAKACEEYLEKNKTKDPRDPKNKLEPYKEWRRKKIYALMKKNDYKAEDLGFEMIDGSPEALGMRQAKILEQRAASKKQVAAAVEAQKPVEAAEPKAPRVENALGNFSAQMKRVASFNRTSAPLNAQKNDAPSVEGELDGETTALIPERKQATIGNGIFVTYKEPQESSWKPAIITAVAGLGAASWWHWNTIKSFATEHMPESIANIFNRFHKASA